MTREEAIASIRKADVESISDNLIASLRPSVLIEASRCPPDLLPVGASRIGGVPDVPAGFEWPRWSGKRTDWERVAFDNKPLHFIAQFNLGDLHNMMGCTDLPSLGMLYFFYDMDVQAWGYDPAHHRGSRAILVSAGADSLQRCENPELATEHESFPCAVRFAEDWTLPDGDYLGVDYAHDMEMYENIGELKADLLGREIDEHWKPIHRLFGWPETIQGDMQQECHLTADGIYCGGVRVEPPSRVDLVGDVSDWILLLQIDTDEDGPGWMWGDCGRIYYWIRKQDLANRRFENTRLILQCS